MLGVARSNLVEQSTGDWPIAPCRQLPDRAAGTASSFRNAARQARRKGPCFGRKLPPSALASNMRSIRNIWNASRRLHQARTISHRSVWTITDGRIVHHVTVPCSSVLRIVGSSAP